MMTATAKKSMRANKKNSSTTSTTKTLNKSNYYSNAQDWATQSKSWFWKFEQCEAEALAELKGVWRPPQNLTPLLVGNYLHSYFESPQAHQKFIEAHKKELYRYGNPDKGIKQDFKKADEMIHTLEVDPNFERLYQGDKEVIVTGELFGVKWRGKVDCLNLDRHLFLDLKTVDDIHKKHWCEADHQYVSFAEARGYDMQMAVYQALIKQTFGVECEPLIIAVSKQDVPDKGAFSVPDSLMAAQLDLIEADQPHIEAVKNGTEKPVRCEHCEYCRSTKTLNDVIDIDEISFY